MFKMFFVMMVVMGDFDCLFDEILNCFRKKYVQELFLILCENIYFDVEVLLLNLGLRLYRRENLVEYFFG